MTTRAKDSSDVSPSARPARQLVDQWRPIETAPKDGRALLMMVAGRVPFVAWWTNDSVVGECAGWWRGDSGYRIYPTHWMPLPAPPALAALLDPAPQLSENKEDDHPRVAPSVPCVAPVGSTAEQGQGAQSSPVPETLCACVSDDAERCLALRYPEHANADDDGEPEKCECSCHDFQRFDE